MTTPPHCFLFRDLHEVPSQALTSHGLGDPQHLHEQPTVRCRADQTGHELTVAVPCDDAQGAESMARRLRSQRFQQFILDVADDLVRRRFI